MYAICSFFFFKQKTAYDMRISDWSSDVCSSDLQMAVHRLAVIVLAAMVFLRRLRDRARLPRVLGLFPAVDIGGDVPRLLIGQAVGLAQRHVLLHDCGGIFDARHARAPIVPVLPP